MYFSNTPANRRPSRVKMCSGFSSSIIREGNYYYFMSFSSTLTPLFIHQLISFEFIHYCILNWFLLSFFNLPQKDLFSIHAMMPWLVYSYTQLAIHNCVKDSNTYCVQAFYATIFAKMFVRFMLIYLGKSRTITRPWKWNGENEPSTYCLKFEL